MAALGRSLGVLKARPRQALPGRTDPGSWAGVRFSPALRGQAASEATCGGTGGREGHVTPARLPGPWALGVRETQAPLDASSLSAGGPQQGLDPEAKSRVF